MTRPANSEKRTLPLLALGLSLIGFVLPVLCWSYWLPKFLLLVACGAQMLALVLGIKARRRWLARFAIAGAAMFFLLAAYLGSYSFPTYPLKVKPTADWMKPLQTHWVTQSAAKPYSIQTDAGMKRNGDDALRFEVRDGDAWVDQTFIPSFRSEVATKEYVPTNSIRWYAFSVYFPTNFPIEANRLVFAQWHQRFVDVFGPKPSPPLAFRFVDGRFSITLRHYAEEVLRDEDDAPRKELFEKKKFPVGQWHDFVVQVKWIWSDDGFVNVWWNNRQIVEYHGPISYNRDAGPHFKFGLYRDETEKTYVAWFNQIRSGGTAQTIGFDPSTATRHSED